MMISLNWEQEQALEKMLSGRNVFLTGGAGTGKSLVINEFRRRCNRSLVCLAPTGLAALNIAGQTIHSFFGLPIGVLVPEQLTQPNPQQAELLRATETILIDEISMVRSDLFQSIDSILRNISLGAKRDQPFGGKQVIVVGDFYQLSPVVPDWQVDQYLKSVYGGEYAFHAHAWRDAKFETALLEDVHRQLDPQFVKILNCIRTGEVIEEILQVMGERWRKEDIMAESCIDHIFELNKLCSIQSPAQQDNTLFIATTRAIADGINFLEYCKLPEPAYLFTAAIDGFFPNEAFPTSYLLEIKTGMRVMLLANKYSPDGTCEFVNGDMGIVVDCHTGYQPHVRVKLDSGNAVKVEMNMWENYKYELEVDGDGKHTIVQKVTGRFYQLPLAPGYAMTIHKAQGKTLDSVRILLGNRGCFAPGQLYTALSRCRSLGGLTLDRRVEHDDLIVSPEVTEFYAKALPLRMDDFTYCLKFDLL